MNKKERIIVAVIFLVISTMTLLDLIVDGREGVSWWHMSIEGLIAVSGFLGFFFLIRGTFELKQTLKDERELSSKLKEESKVWKENSKKYVEGLSQAIDSQLILWGLTKSEKEVAFLLLKGFSLREIAQIRKTTEKTARIQSSSVYSKAQLSGRSQLSAFFLEDLLLSNE